MAYYGLAAGFFQFSQAERQQWIARAVEYSGELTRKEKLYVESLHAELSGDYTKAIERLQTLVEQYPEEKEAHWRMGFLPAHILYCERHPALVPRWHRRANGFELRCQTARPDAQQD